MGEIALEGEPPYRVIPAQSTTARVSKNAVEMTVYVSIHGASPSAFPIQIPMSVDDARALAGQLTASAIAAELYRTRR